MTLKELNEMFRVSVETAFDCYDRAAVIEWLRSDDPKARETVEYAVHKLVAKNGCEFCLDVIRVTKKFDWSEDSLYEPGLTSVNAVAAYAMTQSCWTQEFRSNELARQVGRKAVIGKQTRKTSVWEQIGENNRVIAKKGTK